MTSCSGCQAEAPPQFRAVRRIVFSMQEARLLPGFSPDTQNLREPQRFPAPREDEVEDFGL